MLGIIARTYQFYAGGRSESNMRTVIIPVNHFKVSIDHLAGRPDRPAPPVRAPEETSL